MALSPALTEAAASAASPSASRKEIDAAAKAAFAAGRHADAAELFAQLLALQGTEEHHLVLCNRAAALSKLQRWPEAEADAREAVAAAPAGFVKAHYRLACALQGQGGSGLDEACTVCEAALAIAPGNEQLLALQRECGAARAELPAAPSAAPAVAAASDLVAAAASESTSGEEELPPLEGGEYAAFCRATGNRLFAEEEFGQAVAWYTHAIDAATAPPPSGPPTAADAAAAAADAPASAAAADAPASAAAAAEALVTLRSNRAAALLRLQRWADAAADCDAADALAPLLGEAARRGGLLKAYVRGTVARLHLGEMGAARRLARAALRAALPPAVPCAARVAALREEGVAALRARLRALQAQLRRTGGEDEAEEEEEVEEKEEAEEEGERAEGAERAAAEVRVEELPPSAWRAAARGAPAIEKEELAVQVEAAERAVVAEGAGVALARRARAEVSAMIERVGEVELMMRRKEYAQALEHAGWLADEYPQHAALRAVRLDALLALGRHDDAARLCAALEQAAPDAPELCLAAARIAFVRSGAAPALALLRALPLDAPAHAAAAELCALLRALGAAAQAAQAALDAGRLDGAVARGCEALALCEGSGAARLPLLVLLATALGRLGRHVDAVRCCDAGLALPPPAAPPPAEAPRQQAWANALPRGAAARGAPAVPSERERLLLRRAGCFLALEQPALAVADYRSAAALNPRGAQAAAGLRRAWRALEESRPAAAATLYAILDAPAAASFDELRKAYHRAALRCHPDRHAAADAAQQLAAAEQFKQVQAAWAVLSDAELRAAYDDELESDEARRG